ncbi:MAG TPA: hypothetical protein VH170_08855 [Chthoniobacterales bacterium]|jgi:hypothetical protein|nr:hypothetical protein [Chthoniobacterales bacterium]
MRPLSILFAIVVTLILAACADPLEKTSGQEVGSRLERGVTGGGQIGPQDRDPRDPAAEHGVPQTHP